MIEENALPEGWVTAKLQDIAPPGGTRDPRSNGDIFLYVDIDALDNTAQKIVTPKRISTSEAPSRARMAINAGDIIFSLVRPYLKNIAIVPKELDGQIASTAYCVMRPKDGIVSSFIYFALLRESFINSIVTYGNSPPSAHDDEFLNMSIPLAPTNEQRRIITAIEQQFTRLDAAVTALQHARTKLKRYRAAVLKAAVEGKLTEAWRAEHPATEPASALLERILVERRAKWEADLRAKGKDPSKVKYVEPAQPDVESLPTLPTGWFWATVEQVADVIGGVTKGRNLAGRLTMTLPYLRVANVQRGFINTDVMKTIEVPEDEVGRYLLHMGDVLLTEGGDADKLGRAALWEKPIDKCIHQNHIFRARITDLNITPLWLVHYANSEQGKAYFLKAAKQTVNLASINLTQLRNCPFPLPPNVEQEQIVAEVERNLSIISTLETTVEVNLKRAQRLRQSILKEAFAGLLVPQDPSDERANVLLERIQKEREGQNLRQVKKSRELKTITAPRMLDVEPGDIDVNEMEQMDLWASIGSKE
jgi:type I restriction enzyme, S subunit